MAFHQVVLVGENVDMDVDEPSVTIRWSVLGCGTDFMLPNSPALHGSRSCGLPAVPLSFYVDRSVIQRDIRRYSEYALLLASRKQSSRMIHRPYRQVLATINAACEMCFWVSNKHTSLRFS